MNSGTRWLAGAVVPLLVAGAVWAQSAQTPAKPERTPARPSARPSAQDPECAFTGKRIVNSLARDDVDAAQKFLRFYEMFSCPAEHLRDALRCAVKGGAPAPGRPLSDRVDDCWDKPPAQSQKR